MQISNRGLWPRRHSRHHLREVHLLGGRAAIRFLKKKKKKDRAVGTAPTGHELPPADAAPPPCPKPTSVAPAWEATGGPRRAARMSCTRRRRGTPRPPGDRTWGRRWSAAAVEPLAPTRAGRPSPQSPQSWPSTSPHTHSNLLCRKKG
jgi:hypothetical protein